MSCARCGSGIYKTEEFISLNKIWHKQCFCCYQCSKRLSKESAKIFQGELFCECCYECVIKKLFEVISKASICKPCKVVSSPNCTVNNTNTQCKKAYFWQKCTIRPVQSCSCVLSKTEVKDEYSFLFPLPREVANYYNRTHQINQSCMEPINCCASSPPARCISCYRKPCCCPVQVRTLPNPCCCGPPSSPRCKCFCQSKPCPPPQTCCECCPLPDPALPSPKCSPPFRRRPCSPQRGLPPRRCCPPPHPSPCCCVKPDPCCCRKKACCPKQPRNCICGNISPCNCKMSQVKAQCTAYCIRCCQRVYAAEKILVSFGAFHSSCFTCSCCNKCLDVKNVYEGCGEIYCKQCYNHLFGIKYYGFGRINC